MSKQIPAVTYIRMSSDKQEKSPDQQREEMAKLAARFGCKVLREYLDEGISGDKTEKRKGFQNMIADAETRGDFQVILCWDQDRFGRFDSLEAGYWIKPLRDRGVRLITTAQGEIDWNDFAGRMIYSIQQEGKNQFLVSQSRNSLRGRISSARKGFGVSSPPYGYDRVFYDASGKVVHRVKRDERFTKPRQWDAGIAPAIESDEVETVVWIFNQFANSDTNPEAIARDLNARKVSNGYGCIWTGDRIRLMLRNEVYIGTTVFGKLSAGKYSKVGPDGEVLPRSRADKNWRGTRGVVAKNTHTPLIDAKLFERVQRKMDSRRKEQLKPEGDSPFILSGLLVCGNTGVRMYGNNNQNAGAASYYRSIRRNLEEERMVFSVRQAVMETFVLKVVADLVEDDNRISQAKVRVKAAFQKQAAKSVNVAQLKSQIAKLESKISSGAEKLLVLSAEDAADVSKVLRQLREEKKALMDTLRTGEKGITKDNIDEEFSFMVKHLREALRELSPSKTRAAIKSLIADVTLYFERQETGLNWRVVKGLISFNSDCPIAPAKPLEFTEANLEVPSAKWVKVIDAVNAIGNGSPVLSKQVAASLCIPMKQAKSFCQYARKRGSLVWKKTGWVVNEPRRMAGGRLTQIRDYLRVKGASSTFALQEHLNLPLETVRQLLNNAANAGIVTRPSRGKWLAK